MKEVNRLFEIYKSILIAHIETKTLDRVFHQATEWFYELLFDAFHQISEKRQDIFLDDWGDMKKLPDEIYDLLTEAQEIINQMIKNNNHKWMDNLLRWLTDKLDWAIWDSLALIKEEEDE